MRRSSFDSDRRLDRNQVEGLFLRVDMIGKPTVDHAE